MIVLGYFTKFNNHLEGKFADALGFLYKCLLAIKNKLDSYNVQYFLNYLRCY